MSQTTHDFGRYTFGAGDHPDGHVFVRVEPSGGGLKALGGGTLFLQLRPDVDLRHAEALALQLNELVEGIEHAQPAG